jgi:Carboxypeptidase regulatory-like domain
MRTGLLSFILTAIAAMAASISFGPDTQAQSTFGSIVGVVKDPGQGLVAGAQITLVSADDNTQHTATTNSDGAYELLNLRAGHYNLLVQASGFSDYKLSGLQLDARQALREDVQLKLASSSQTIEVQGESGPAINTENATLSNAEYGFELTAMPINSRAVTSSPLSALATNPNVTSDSQGNVSVGGSSAAQTGFSVDGISTANVRANGALKDAYPSLEGIQEMNVTAFNNNAEFAQIGDVTFTTKAGANKFHGSVFEYFQNNHFDSTIYNFTTKAPKTFNTFGGSLGGPVFIPKLWNGRDKTFFFFDYEGNRKRTSAPELLLVPTAAQRAGDLSGLVAPGTALLDPFTGTPYPNNTIPGGPGNPCSNAKDCINPVAQKLLNGYYPLPNVNGNGYNYQTLVPIPSNSNGWDLRIDRTLTSKQQLYARFSWKNVFLNEFNNDTVIAPANLFLPNDQAHEQNRSLVVSYNYAITPNLINEFRFGLTNFTENETFSIQGAQALSQLGLVLDNGINLALHPTGQAFPTFAFSDGTVTSIGQGRVGTTISRTYQFTDNVTRVVRQHALRFGVDVRRVAYGAPLYFQPSDDYGQFSFTGALTNYSFGDFLLGLPQSFFAITAPQINAYSWHWGLYGQDQWQVNSHLTLNFGLRWEYLPAFKETRGDIASFDPRLNSIVVPDKFSALAGSSPLLTSVYTAVLKSYNGCSLPDKLTSIPCTPVISASQAGLPQGLRNTPLHNFDPRVSIAYRPFNNDKTVIRAGFGLFTMTTLGPLSYNNAGVTLSALLSFPNSVTNGTPAFQFPQTSVPGQVALGGGSFEEGNNIYMKDATSAQWNLTVERQLTPNTTIRLSYVGQGTYHLPVTVDLTQLRASTTPYVATLAAGEPSGIPPWADPRSPYPQFGLLMYSDSIGNSNYQAGIAELRHRTSYGLTFLGNYTWAKNISNAQGSDAPAVSASEEPYAVEIADRFNLRHDRGNVIGTPRQRFLFTGTYDLPYGSGRRWSGGGKILSTAFGGWSLSTVTQLQTGQWLTPIMSPVSDQSNTDLNNLRFLGGAIARPDCTGNLVPSNRSPQNYYNISAFALPPVNAGRFGTCGLGILQGPGEINVNAGLAKQLSLTERLRLRFEATFTNVLNHTNFAPPALNISNPSTFGVLNATLPPGLGGNRTGQLALRLDF